MNDKLHKKPHQCRNAGDISEKWQNPLERHIGSLEGIMGSVKVTVTLLCQSSLLLCQSSLHRHTNHLHLEKP